MVDKKQKVDQRTLDKLKLISRFYSRIFLFSLFTLSYIYIFIYSLFYFILFYFFLFIYLFFIYLFIYFILFTYFSFFLFFIFFFHCDLLLMNSLWLFAVTSVSGAKIINNPWARYSHIIPPKIKMSNHNITQCRTQTTGLCVMTGRCSPDSQHVRPDRHPTNVGCSFFRHNWRRNKPQRTET